MFEPTATFVRSDEPIVSVIDNQVVMLSVREAAYFSFNDVASDIWNLLAEPITFASLCDALSKTYRADEDTLVSEASAFLESLIERGLARVDAPNGRS